MFILKNVKHKTDLSAMRWTLDYPEDLQFATEVYDRLYTGRIFGMDAILDLLEVEPHLMRINSGIARNTGYESSLSKEARDNSE